MSRKGRGRPKKDSRGIWRYPNGKFAPVPLRERKKRAKAKEKADAERKRKRRIERARRRLKKERDRRERENSLIDRVAEAEGVSADEARALIESGGRELGDQIREIYRRAVSGFIWDADAGTFRRIETGESVTVSEMRAERRRAQYWDAVYAIAIQKGISIKAARRFIKEAYDGDYWDAIRTEGLYN